MRRAVVAMAAVMVACGGDGEAVVSTVPTTLDATTTTGEVTTTVVVTEAESVTTVTVAEPTTIPPNSVARSTVPYAPSDGWAIPGYIVHCESGGDYGAENPRSSASGAYQIVDGTWDGYGGYDRAVDAPPAVQDAKAAELWRGGAGRGHWAACL